MELLLVDLSWLIRNSNMQQLPYDTNGLIAKSQAMLDQTKAEGSKPFAGSGYDTPAGSVIPQPKVTPQAPVSTPTAAKSDVATTPTPSVPVAQKSPDANFYTRVAGGAQALPDGYDTAKKITTQVQDPATIEANIRATEMNGVQDRVSAVNKIYDTERADQTKVNENSSGRTTALSGLMGLSGSSAADARATNTDNNSKQALDLVEAKRQTALSAIYSKVDDNVMKLKEAALNTNRENAKSMYDEVAKSALDTVQSLASTVANNGATWDDFKAKDPAMAQNLVDQSGKSEYVLRELWKSQIPEQFKPVDHTDYFDDGKGGTVMKKVSFNPVTKQVETQEYPIAAPLSMFKAADKPLEVNGMLLVKQMDGTYKNMAPTKIEAPKTMETAQGILQFNTTTGKWEKTGFTPYNKPSTGASAQDVSDALLGAINGGMIDPNRLNSRTIGIYNKIAAAGVDAVGAHAGSAGETKAVQDLTAYKSTATRTLGVIDKNLPLVSGLADKVNTLGVPGVDEILRGVKSYTGNNPDVIKYVNSLKVLRSEYAQMLSKGAVATEGDKREAEQAIPAGLSKSGYEALGQQLKLEANNIISSSNDSIRAAKDKSGSNTAIETTSIKDRATAAGYNYDAMIKAGHTDAEINTALNKSK